MIKWLKSPDWTNKQCLSLNEVLLQVGEAMIISIAKLRAEGMLLLKIDQQVNVHHQTVKEYLNE